MPTKFPTCCTITLLGAGGRDYFVPGLIVPRIYAKLCPLIPIVQLVCFPGEAIICNLKLLLLLPAYGFFKNNSVNFCGKDGHIIIRKSLSPYSIMQKESQALSFVQFSFIKIFSFISAILGIRTVVYVTTFKLEKLQTISWA